MKEIKYSPDAVRKLLDIKTENFRNDGEEKAKTVIKSITEAVDCLAPNERRGASVSDMFGIDAPHRFIFTSKNYVFYRIEEKHIYIVDVYNEREDFMWKLFGIDSNQQGSPDYSGE